MTRGASVIVPAGFLLTSARNAVAASCGNVQIVAAPWRATGLSRVKTASRQPTPSVSTIRTV